jgi:hypothetical protein
MENKSKLRNVNIRLLNPFILVAYAIVTFGLGLFTGFGFGQFQRKRFQLISLRLDDIEQQFNTINLTHTAVNQTFIDYILPKSKIIKARGFSSDCPVGNREKFNSKVKMNYTLTPQFFYSIAGVGIDLSDKVNKLDCKSSFELKKIDSVKNNWIVEIDPQNAPIGDPPLCWVAVPGVEFP